MRSFCFALLATLAGLSSAPVQHSTIGRDAFRARADLSTDRDAIVGSYVLQLPGGQQLPIKFFVDGTRLMAQALGQQANEIRYLGNYEFGVAFDPALRFTFTIEGGKATKVTLLQGGVKMDGPRAP